VNHPARRIEGHTSPENVSDEPLCLVDGCDEPAAGRVKAYCEKHLEQRRKAREDRRTWWRQIGSQTKGRDTRQVVQ
jgi:siroheme synthase (precorrin-2 oxidase/ferrochelatase)